MGVRHVIAPAGARKYGIISNPATRIIKKKRLVVIIKYRGQQKKKETTPPVATFFLRPAYQKSIYNIHDFSVYDNLARNVLLLKFNQKMLRKKKSRGESVG